MFAIGFLASFAPNYAIQTDGLKIRKFKISSNFLETHIPNCTDIHLELVCVIELLYNAFLLLDSPLVIDLKSSTSSSCSVLVNNIEHSRNELGINVVVLDPITLNVEETESFDTGHFPDASIKLTEYIQSLPLTSMVFIVVRGEGNFFLTGNIFL